MYWTLACLLFACFTVTTFAAETPAPTWPLWDDHESIEQYAKRTNLPPTKTLDLGNGVNLELVLIPAGKFVMGTPEPVEPTHNVNVGQAVLGVGSLAMLAMVAFVVVRAVPRRQRPQYSLLGLLAFVVVSSVALYGGIDWWQTAMAWREYEAALVRYQSSYDFEKPAHEVTLTKPYYMGKYEVTQEQYAAVTGTNPSQFRGPRLPVETVSWGDAMRFCMRVTRPSGSGLDPEDRVTARLPTEAEWEFACRAGTNTTYYAGDKEADLRRAGWYNANSNSTTHPVGRKEPNAWALYDMSGNVWEWCLYPWQEPYSPEALVDPRRLTDGQLRKMRGGSWYYDAKYCRSAYQGWSNHENVGSLVGFRVVVALPPTTP